jgi:alpha-glucosidase
MLAFVRATEGQRILCVFNFAVAEASWKLPDTFADFTRLATLDFGERLDGRTLTLPPYAAFFARLG